MKKIKIFALDPTFPTILFFVPTRHELIVEICPTMYTITNFKRLKTLTVVHLDYTRKPFIGNKTYLGPRSNA